MSGATNIEWADAVWNPTTGCDRVSPGCDHCYALTMAARLKGMGQPKYQRDGDPRTSGPGFGIREHRGALDEPLTWRKPRRVFVNSMSDLFHDGVSDAFIWSVWITMARTPQHTYQVLTKRHGRMRSLLQRWTADGWFARDVEMHWNDLSGHLVNGALPNVWLGVSVEDQKRADLRIPALLDTPAAVRFLSCEPLLGPVDLGRYAYGDEDRLHWVIVGGESGRGARPMHPGWARSLRDQCAQGDDGPAFFFKQWGAWAPAPWSIRVPDPHAPHAELEAAKRSAEAQGATHAIQPGGSLYEPPHRPRSIERTSVPAGVEGIHRVGKAAAGRELDGRTWDEFPAGAS